MKANPAATLAVRIIGLLTLGWAWLAYADLGWLLHLHRVHVLVLHNEPFTFNYGDYFACTIANLVAPLLLSATLLLFPEAILKPFTSSPGKSRSPGARWLIGGVAAGLGLLIVSIHGIFATALWTIYRSGKNDGWQSEVLFSILMAGAGILLCRKVMAGRCEA